MDGHCPEHSAHERAIVSHDKRLDSHSQSLDTLMETLATLKEIEHQNQERIDRMDERLAEIEAKPAKRWDAVLDKALTVLIAAVLGFALAQIGIN